MWLLFDAASTVELERITGTNLVRNLQCGPRTWLVRGISVLPLAVTCRDTEMHEQPYRIL